MSHPFAKIVELDGEQTLYFLEEAEDADAGAVMHQIIYLHGIRVDAKVGPMPWETADKMLARIDDEHTRTIRKAVSQMIRGEQP